MKVRGFTLIELMVVIVILAVVATAGTQFIVSTIQSYNQTQTRSKLINTGRQAIERVTRQLRGALPYSLRLTNTNACIEFLPIAGGGNYLADLPDTDNGAPAAISFATATHAVDFGTAEYVSVGSLASTEVYGAGPVSLATLDVDAPALVTLTAAKSWQRNSINRRFYLVDNPQAFCVQSGELRFYQNLDVTAASVPGLAGACVETGCSVLAQNISGAADFQLSAGTEDRNTKVTVGLSFVEGGETVTLSQGVLIRNVP